jgi:PAS domain S-box-containing protein
MQQDRHTPTAKAGNPVELLRQQTALAKFGELALTSDDLDHILTEACLLVREGIGTDLAKVMALQDDGETLLVRAAVGWQPGIVGKLTLKAAENTSEGVALRTGEPMISADIATEKRFGYPAFLTDNGVHAVANVVIIGGLGKPPFGILQVDSRKPRAFIDAEITFLRSYANLLAAAAARLRLIVGIRDGEERLRLALEAGGLGSWEMDLDSGTGNHTARSAEIFGHPTPVPWSFDIFMEHVIPEDRKLVTEAFRGATKTRAEWHVECRIRRADDGEMRWIETRGKAIAANGNVAASHLLGVTTDITDRVRTEERMQQGQRVEALGRLTAGVAHDFNNVLQTLLGGLELAIEGVADRPEVLADLEFALQAGQRGARLTSHLLSFSRKQMLLPAPLDLAPFLQQLVATLRRMLTRSIRIDVQAAANLPPVLVDAAQLDAALLNLGLNSRDAMPTGGELRFEAYQAQGQVVVAVVDTGEGMTQEVLAHACEPFFSTKGANGSGLGLAMVEGFTRQSGGELQIRSERGRGTRIELWLPSGSGAAIPDAKRTARPTRGQGKVLLVDDDVQVGKVAGAFLRRAGFEVTLVENGNEALHELRAEVPFDVMVTDYDMPGMNGAELALYARELHPGMATLVITGYSDSDRFDHFLHDVEIIRKPFNREDLVRRVGKLIDAATRSPVGRVGSAMPTPEAAPPAGT